MFERSDDPVRDADSYNADMDNRPEKPYIVTIDLAIEIPITARDKYEAGNIASSISEDIRDAIYALNSDYEVTNVDETGCLWKEDK